MKTSLVIPALFFAACATTGSSGKGSSAPFQGESAVQKRQTEIQDAAKTAMDCMKVKAGEDPGKGGVFAVSADAAGKLKIDAMKWEGPEPMKQCIVDTSNKVTVTPLPGPSVGTVWEFVPPGQSATPAKAPDDFAVLMQPLSTSMQDEIKACGDKFLGVDFSAKGDVSYYLYNTGQAYAPTIIHSNAKDGSFESCVQDVILKTKFPVVTVAKPFPSQFHFKVGITDTNERVQ
ncbi:MAG TPA: hypothetical protein VGL86_14615 [Polyangia bacterium]|jgi:hypothetical protein